MQSAIHEQIIHQYVIHGYGNSIMVQARLAERGRCYHTEWDPGPPSWRLTYDTRLSQPELEQFLQDMSSRYSLIIKEVI